MSRISGGTLVARILKLEGVEYIFTLCGGEIDPILQECTDEGIKVIDTRHEQAAVFAAEGWAMATGKPGIVAATAGPGMANAVTGIWDAREKGCPIIVFGGRIGVPNFDMGAMLDTNQLGLVDSVAKWARSCFETRRIAEYVSTAFRQAVSGRPGPAYLEFPMNVLDAQVEESDVVWPTKYRTAARGQGDPDMVEEAVDLLLDAKRPIIIGGSGLWWSQAADALRKFVELTGIPFSGGNGYLPSDHPLSFRSRIGTDQADLICIIGKRLNFMAGFGQPPLFAEEAKCIQIDIESTEIGRNRPIDIGIVGDAHGVIEQMTEAARVRCNERSELPWVQELRNGIAQQPSRAESLMNSEGSPVHPARICREIRDVLDRDATVIIDGGEITGWGMGVLNTYHPGHLLTVVPSGMLGIGTGYAIAAQLARPGKQVLLLSGDGSFGLNAMEFDTLARHRLPIVSVISNDSGWGMIKRIQLQKENGRAIASDLGFIRYDKVVEALGGYGEAVDKPEDISPAIERAFASGLPACINVRTAF